MLLNKKGICIICNSKELFRALKRALHVFFPKSNFLFYDTSKLRRKTINDIKAPSYKKAGALIAFISGSDDQLTCRIIKYLRIQKKIQYPLVYCSFANNNNLITKYSVLTYGASSHRYCTAPIDLIALANIIYLSLPMNDGNHALFCKEHSGKHRQFYDARISPLLTRVVAQYEWNAWLTELEQLIEQLINDTPLTCHGKIEFQKINKSLSDHLRNEVAALKKIKDSNTTDLSGINSLLKYWLNLVTKELFG